MNIVLNTDIIYPNHFIRNEQSFPTPLRALVNFCKDQNARIIIPETTLLEFRRRHLKQGENEKDDISKAYRTLDKHNIDFEKENEEEVIDVPGIDKLLEGAGVDVEVVIPSENELREAHRRACLHEPPIDTTEKDSEMRDVIIWLVANRLSSSRGLTLLLGRENIFNSTRGDDEAEENNLLRARSVEDAMEKLELESPSTRLAQRLLEPVWGSINRIGDKQISDDVVVKSVKNTKFVQGKNYIKEASFFMKAKDDEGVEMHADVNIYTESDQRKVNMYNIQVNGCDAENITVSIPVSGQNTNYTDRLSSLKKIMNR